jgi:hypothetical protein
VNVKGFFPQHLSLATRNQMGFRVDLHFASRAKSKSPGMTKLGKFGTGKRLNDELARCCVSCRKKATENGILG